MNNIPAPPQIVMIDRTEGTIAPSRQLSQPVAPLVRTKNLVELALHQRNDIGRYSVEQLAAELQRQTRLLAEREDLTPDQKSQLRRLTQDCITKLQAVNVALNDQLVEIILR